MSDTFDRAFAAVVGVEGGLSMVPTDPGNWTGGAQGKGELRGTKYGISAARWYGKTSQWPPTLDDARAIYKSQYWESARCDELPPPVALVLFDARVNGGDPVRWMQGAAGAVQDGKVGDKTIAAVKAAKAADVVAEINARRIVYDAGRENWDENSLGWSRRIAHLCMAAVGFEDAPVVTVQTINPAPVVASLDDVRTAVREIVNEKVVA